MGATVLQCYNSNSNGVIVNSGDTLTTPTVTITSGATKGSTSVTVNTTSGIRVHKLILISGLNPSFVHYIPGNTGPPTWGRPNYMGHDGTRLLNCMHYVTSISGKTVNFSPPLPIDMSGHSPMITPYSIILSGFGVEDITFDLSHVSISGGLCGAVFLDQAYGCWMKGIEVVGAPSRQIWFYRMVNSEIRQCYFHDAQGSGPNHEGIDLALSCCFNLIEDNICVNEGKPAIILGDYGGGCSGNVIGYNYINIPNIADNVLRASISVNHGPHNLLNLVEGNVGQSIQSDGYFGSASHCTFFRNYMSGAYPSIVQWPHAVRMDKWSYYMSFVGNVLGKAGLGQIYTTTTSGYSPTTNVIWVLGFPNVGNPNYVAWPPHPSVMSNPPNSDYENPAPNGSTNTAYNGPFDSNVSATIIRHGNYDYASNSTVWDPTILDHTIPDSLYLAGKPSWWGALAWPPMGPDRTPMVNQIPAECRFVNGLPTLTPTPTSSATPSSPQNRQIKNNKKKQYNKKKPKIQKQKWPSALLQTTVFRPRRAEFELTSLFVFCDPLSLSTLCVYRSCKSDACLSLVAPALKARCNRLRRILFIAVRVVASKATTFLRIHSICRNRCSQFYSAQRSVR